MTNFGFYTMFWIMLVGEIELYFKPELKWQQVLPLCHAGNRRNAHPLCNFQNNEWSYANLTNSSLQGDINLPWRSIQKMESTANQVKKTLSNLLGNAKKLNLQGDHISQYF